MGSSGYGKMNTQRIAEIKQKLIAQGLTNKYDHSGVYTISIDGVLVYIGQSFNMLERVAQHIDAIEHPEDQTAHKYQVLHEAREKGHKIGFDVIYLAAAADKEAIHDELRRVEAVYINRRKPPLNYQIPSLVNPKSFTVQRSAKTITLDQILGHK